MKKVVRQILSVALVIAIILSFSCLPASALTYEKAYNSLIKKNFPESYAKLLANVKVKHPNWDFDPMFTELDWDYVIEQESTPRTNVVFVSTENSVTRLFASRSVGEYQPCDGLDYTYVVRDRGSGGYYVDASSMAVAEFMNPLHFIGNDVTVLMFEELGWGDLKYKSAVSGVKSMLKGTFMSDVANDYNKNYVDKNGNIKYKNTKGKTVTTEITYAEAICTAAKENNINPYYLTSKILGEVGTTGTSGSVTGTNSSYPGYYNYLNIGATDSSSGSAVTNGLRYAKSQGWKSPEIAITDGAAFLANGYIAAGQSTPYLQKFNVKVGSINTQHQYMTSVNGVHYTLQKTYDGYKANETLENVRKFTIPVYENMPDATGTSIEFKNVKKGGIVNSERPTVRTAPNYGAALATLDKKGVTVAAGVHNNGDVSTTGAMYYGALWYKVGDAYVIEDYVDVSAKVEVKKGSTIKLETVQNKDSTEKPRFMSWDTRIATVDTDGVVTGVTKGTTKVVAYLSNGAFAVINVKVGSKTTNQDDPSNDTPKEENITTRIYGDDRYETSLKTADVLKKSLSVEKFDTIIVAYGRNFADALAGSYLATVKKAPILIVNTETDMSKTNERDYASMEMVKNYIDNNLADNGVVYVLGGKAVISKDYANSLKAEGRKVKRLSGETRYETNIAILREAGFVGSDLLVADAYGYADALSASSLGKPILLVDKTSGELSDTQKTYLSEFSGDIKNVYLVGGTAAVPKSFENEIGKVVPDAELTRFAGETRYETSKMLADKFFSKPTTVTLAYGHNFPDGLCGGPLSFVLEAPLLLTYPSNENSSYAKSYVKANSTIKSVIAFGGKGSSTNPQLTDTLLKSIFDSKIVKEKY